MRLKGNLELLEKEVGVQYAGLFVDSRRGIIYVGLVKPTREQMESIINVMRPSSKVKIVFYEAQLTLRQLEEAADKITARLDELNQAEVPIRGWGVDVVKNKLIVDFEELREEYKTIVRQIVGEDIPIEFKKVGPYVLTSKTARYNLLR